MSEDHDDVDGLEDINFIEDLDDNYTNLMALTMTIELRRALTIMTTVNPIPLTMTTRLPMVLMAITSRCP